MKHSYIIVEDNIGAVKNLQYELKKYPDFYELGIYSCIQDALKSIVTNNPAIVFLDVTLENENGFDLLRELKTYSSNLPCFIMSTGDKNHAMQAVNLDIFYFLEKPIEPSELTKALSKYLMSYKETQQHIVVKEKNGSLLVRFADILYLKADDNYCIFFLKDANRLSVPRTLKDIEEKLPSNFLRVHRSYIVNADHVNMINKTERTMHLSHTSSAKQFESDIPIGENYLEKVRFVMKV
ncbi:LytR/AlgR family response regulator transcription factor [Fluviicola sp.]|uniref:LytR/AlgR family response regulator transcription factor n=1 Tax=Fluviicola sp. TaxID=1917219 RepID=UPI003D2CF91C